MEQVNIDAELLDGDKAQYVGNDDEFGMVVLQEARNDGVDVDYGFVTTADENDDFIGRVRREGNDAVIVPLNDSEPVAWIHVKDETEIPATVLNDEGFITLSLIN